MDINQKEKKEKAGQTNPVERAPQSKKDGDAGSILDRLGIHEYEQDKMDDFMKRIEKKY